MPDDRAALRPEGRPARVRAVPERRRLHGRRADLRQDDAHVRAADAGEGKCSDSDGDGLSDGDETDIGTDPHDADSDDDGVKDGNEPMPGKDSDGDGKINALDPDSDNDGLHDGTELGVRLLARRRPTPAPATACRTATWARPRPIRSTADTDHGSVKDGDEDTNHDGMIDTRRARPEQPGGRQSAAGRGQADDDAARRRRWWRWMRACRRRTSPRSRAAVAA